MGRGGARGGKSGGRQGGAKKGRVGKKSNKRKGARTQNASKPTDAADEMNLTISIGDVRGLFVNSTSFDQHKESQEKDAAYYQAAMLVLVKHKLELSSGSKARALAAAITRHDHELMKAMLEIRDVFGMVEVTKALNILDSKRQLKRLVARQEKLKAMKTELKYNVKKGKFSKLKNQIGNCEKLNVSGSLSGAVARHIRRWVKTIPESELEFYALHYPKDPWKSVADLVHLNPTKDFQLNWFLGYCFGGQAPDGTMVERCSKISKENVNEIASNLNVPYAYLKQFNDWLNDETKIIIAKRETVTTVIWWYEDLKDSNNGVNEVINSRLEAGEKIEFSYGKLMERIFTLKKFPAAATIVGHMMKLAESELRNISIALESPIAILGDKSSSMQVCVTTSNIIASLLAMICDAHLNFFDSDVIDPPFYPSNVEKVLELSATIKASNCTAPAASLYPFYEKKQHVNTFVVVTDEEENTSYKSFRFAELYKKYEEEIHKAKLVFVSFLSSQHADGQMVKALKKKGVENIQQFRFDQRRPDLTKLDNMLAILSTAGDWFEQEVLAVKQQIAEQGLLTTFANIKIK